MSTDRELQPIPQIFVIGGFKRDCAVECEKCGQRQVFTVYSDEERNDDWCDAELDSMLHGEEWSTFNGDDYCPECTAERES